MVILIWGPLRWRRRGAADEPPSATRRIYVRHEKKRILGLTRGFPSWSPLTTSASSRELGEMQPTCNNENTHVVNTLSLPFVYLPSAAGRAERRTPPAKLSRLGLLPFAVGDDVRCNLCWKNVTQPLPLHINGQITLSNLNTWFPYLIFNSLPPSDAVWQQKKN